MERLLPFFVSKNARGGYVFTGYLLSTIGNALTLAVYAAGIALGLKVVL